MWNPIIQPKINDLSLVVVVDNEAADLESLCGFKMCVYLPELGIIMVGIDQDAEQAEECRSQRADEFVPKIDIQGAVEAELKRLFPQKNAETEVFSSISAVKGIEDMANLYLPN